VITQSTYSELEFACHQLKYSPTAELRGLTYTSDGQPRMIVLFDNWTENTVTMHQWCEAPRYFSRSLIKESFRYAFGIGGKEISIGLVRSDNPVALRLDRGLGYTDVGVIKDAYGPGIDMHILQLRRDACRWYKSDGL